MTASPTAGIPPQQQAVEKDIARTVLAPERRHPMGDRDGRIWAQTRFDVVLALAGL